MEEIETSLLFKRKMRSDLIKTFQMIIIISNYGKLFSVECEFNTSLWTGNLLPRDFKSEDN